MKSSIIYKDLDPNNIPRHVAVIMDGNGRWATKRGLPRSEGHRAGTEAIIRVMDAAIAIGIECVSIYAFSTENWKRPKTEIAVLWKLLDEFFSSQIESLSQKGVRVVHSGLRKKLPASVLRVIDNSAEITKKNKKITLNLCLNYGGRAEIVDAVNEWMKDKKKGKPISEAQIRKHMYRPELPDVDLMIRTSGESRISNFLLWQSSYAELLFVDELWPDFTGDDVYRAVKTYQLRSRRFGGL